MKILFLLLIIGLIILWIVGMISTVKDAMRKLNESNEQNIKINNDL